MIGERVGEEGKMFVHGLVRPQFVRTESPRGVNCLAKFGCRMEEEHSLLDDVEPVQGLVSCDGERERLGEVRHWKRSLKNNGRTSGLLSRVSSVVIILSS